MSLVAEFDIHCEGLPLVDVAAAAPDATVVLRLQFNHGPRPLFVFSVTDGDPEVVEEALAETGDVAGYTRIGTAGGTYRYQATPGRTLAEQLGPHVDDLDGLKALATAEAVVERIEVLPDGWRQTGWFADREAFDQFRRYWVDNAGFRLHRLTRKGEAEPAGDGLTDPQREALRTAYQRGYFDIPRGASLDDVAAELGVSASSVSERLRRAQTRIIEETVATTWPPLPE